MTDIVSRAKRLLEDATPGPWSVNYIDPDYADLNAAPAMENGLMTLPVLISDIYGEISSESDAELIAAAPELAEAVAGMYWEYAVEEKWLTPEGKVWQLATGAEWYNSYRAAEESADPEWHTRIVRRRVSPPEVME